MNMRDLSKDDDFLSHLLVEKLGTGTVPLMVHKMDSSRRLPKTDTQDLMKIVRRVSPGSTIFVSINLRRDLLIRRVPMQLVGNKLPLQQVVRQAVDELLTYVAPPHRVVHHEPVLIASSFLAFPPYVTISNHILKNR